MKLEEAIKVLNDAHDDFLKDELDYAIETVIPEIKRLQKENEELKDERNGYRTQVNSAFDNGFIHKDKIRDCLEDIEDYFENVSVPEEDIEFIKEKRKDLLKEE